MTEIDTTLLIKTFRAAIERGLSPEAKHKAEMVCIALEQWPNKSAEDQATERRFIERDIADLQSMLKS